MLRLPPFLRFLEPRVRRPADGLTLLGALRVERQIPGGPLELVHDSKNFIVEGGLTALRDILIGPNGGGFTGSIFRMAVGDGGTPPGQLFDPYLPDATWPAKTELFHEMLRQDISTFTTPAYNSMRFVGSFNSPDLVVSSYSSADRVVNEACLIAGDGVLTAGGDQVQVHSTQPPPPKNVADLDEVMVSMRTFKSASFDILENVTITITWTLTLAKA